jgi:magnesium chelatase family protein
MSLAHVYTRALVGINAPLVTVEVHLSNGLPALSIVGLPEAAVKESRDRVRSAIINSGFEFPNRRLTINLAPADLPKEGGRFDLPIALGILAASGQIDREILQSYEFAGELSLGGTLQRISGVLPSLLKAGTDDRMSVIPQPNAAEALLVKNTTTYTASHLLEITRHLSGDETLRPLDSNEENHIKSKYDVDMSEVHGQPLARRALEIAAAGQHSLIFIGPPGTGKSMLAERLPTIMPHMSEAEALETAAVQSLATNPEIIDSTIYLRPFRSPHHTASAAALVGGGPVPKPGEISLSHNGILFLDELPEFNRHVLESLREPLESGRIIISRATRQAEFPANVQLIAAMNPCPCGYLGDSQHACSDTPDQIRRYQAKISGPFLDRIDLFVEVPRMRLSEMANHRSSENSEIIRSRVKTAREQQNHRAGVPNARMKSVEVKQYCSLSDQDQRLLFRAVEQFGLSTRAYDRILRVARTIADLGSSEYIQTPHLTEAINYRRYFAKSL